MCKNIFGLERGTLGKAGEEFFVPYYLAHGGIYIHIYVYIYIYIYIIYIYIYVYVITGRNRFGSIRFVSVFFEKSSSFGFGSARFGLAISFSGSMRFGLRFLNASCFGPVRFGSASGSCRFQN